MIHPLSWAVSVLTLVFYVSLSWLLQLVFFRDGEVAARWRLQPSVAPSVDASLLPWLAVLRRKPGVAASPPGAAVMAAANTLLAAAAAGFTAEAALRGASSLHDAAPAGAAGWAAAASALVLSIALQSVAEYYWHRAMHTRLLYANFHYIHHANRAPTPFDDMCIHPLEALGYYCILYSPAFLVRQHWAVFLVYMAVMGVLGIVDHSGVRFSFLGVYASADHDLHHSAFCVNYSFPFPVMDIVHNTYDGVFCGRRYRSARRGGAGAYRGDGVTRGKTD